MIDAENSFKRFKALKELAKNNKGYIEPTLYESEIETIIQALEKQIPKEVVVVDYALGETEYRCPSCGSLVSSTYCEECGQKLDW